MVLVHVSNLCGGVVVAIGNPHRDVVVGASSRIEPAGNWDGSCISLDVKVLFLIATWERDRWRETTRNLFHQVLMLQYVGLWIRQCPAVRCNIFDDVSDSAGLILTGCRNDASWHCPPASEELQFPCGGGGAFYMTTCSECNCLWYYRHLLYPIMYFRIANIVMN